jgi:hypothetical protein
MEATELFIGAFAVVLVLAGVYGLIGGLGSKRRLEPPRCGYCGTQLVRGTWCPVCDRESVEGADTRPLEHHSRYPDESGRPLR